MPDYQKMYITLFQRVTAAISDLQEVQRQTEEMYISSEPIVLSILEPNDLASKISDTEE